MIASVADFIRYFESIRRRTWAVVDRVTPDLIDWAPRAGEFTCGEIVRHLAGAERFYVAKVIDDRWTSDLEPGPPLPAFYPRAMYRSRSRLVSSSMSATLALTTSPILIKPASSPRSTTGT